MFGVKAMELAKEADRNSDSIVVFNDDGVRRVLQEMNVLFACNLNDANASDDNRALWTSVQARHIALERNKRCLIAYLYDRIHKIRSMRWEFGPIVPPEIRELLSDEEVSWFSKYSTNLASYMRSLGRDVGYNGLDLTENLKPPKSLYMEVICLTDYGKFELEDGTSILLKKNTRHYLPTSECQTLIRQGILQHII